MSVINNESSELLQEGKRVMEICNSCRYCEGFCAVFPAMERRLDFSSGDIKYLANLCHDCRECYYSCQYAPPHEFQVNVPKALAAVRQQIYKEYAWPLPLVRLFGNSGRALLISAVIIPILFLLASLLVLGPATLFTAYADAEGSFYRIVSHSMMVWSFGPVSIFVLIALIVGWCRFRDEIAEGNSKQEDRVDIWQAIRDALSLRYLGGSGQGCAYPDERASNLRRRYHHFTFYGFMLCFAATTVATIYHYVFGWIAPYPFLSLPVLLGTAGGIGLLIGPLGLLYLKQVRDPEPAESLQTKMDISFLLLLFMTSLTGLLLMLLRETAAMGVILLIHLGIVMGLFLTIPYGKFVHGIYRFGALLHNAKEERGA
jgi:citrate/tricarballylate utilization protein